VSGVSKGRARCHGEDTEPVLCKDTAMKSDSAMWVLISERDSAKLDLLTCFTLLHLLSLFWQRKRLCSTWGRGAMPSLSLQILRLNSLFVYKPFLLRLGRSLGEKRKKPKREREREINPRERQGSALPSQKPPLMVAVMSGAGESLEWPWWL
jgi:hypothetical protein